MQTSADLFAARGMHWNVPNWQGPQLYGRVHDRDTGESLERKVRDPGYLPDPLGPTRAVERRPTPSERRRPLDNSARLKFNYLANLAKD